MRWFWIDRFTEFSSGSHAKGIKNVSLDEEAVDDYLATLRLIVELVKVLDGEALRSFAPQP